MPTASTEYCDLVMKGGITSGIVYPTAVLALAERYTFKNIGGTSAGAIAAAATAAAALGERRRRINAEPAEGFAGLAAVAEQLRRPGAIARLFQPAPRSRAAFRLIMALASKPTAFRTAFSVLLAVLTTAPLATAVTFVVLLGTGWLISGAPGAAGAALPALLMSAVIGGFFAVRRTALIICETSMGICPGTVPENGGGEPQWALSEWLHSTLQRLSGQTDRPLLFEDLWNAPRLSDEPGDRAITLEMITTGISHHEPRSLPFAGSSFWFRAEEIKRLVPRSVVDWMVAQDDAPITSSGRVYHRLPAGGRLPVVLAARMSLSFPLLISAVRLYEPDWSRKRTPDERGTADIADAPADVLEATDALTTSGGDPEDRPASFRPCWFSDGGISSNFPIHLFDAPLPRWPTFAIDLVYPQDEGGNPDPGVFLPSENNQAWQRRYTAIERSSGVAQLAAFLFAILATMQNWRDLLQSRAPGHRDRIVRVPLARGEGGLNLDMDQQSLERLSEKGAEAGRKLATDFSFNNHWWVRWRNAASATERFTVDLSKAVNAEPTLSYADARSSALTGAPPPPSYRMTQDQQSDAQDRLKQMIENGLHWEDTDPDLTKGAPRPLPQLRIVPTY